ncbi:MAG: M56 family metallopeptidase [Planctomycetota bacterium]
MIGAAPMDVVASLDRLAAPVIDWLGTYALHATIALAVTLLVTRVLGRRRLMLQDVLLRQSLWLPIVSASLQVALAGSPFSMSVAAPELSLAELGQMLEVAEAQAAPAAGEDVSRMATWPWFAIGLGVALVMALWGVASLMRSWLRLRRLLADRTPETDARLLSNAAELAARLGLRQSPSISRSEELATPIAFGFLRPEICLPARAAMLDDSSLRAMLGHELAHLRRADSIWMWFAAWLQALCPWQLLLVPARRQWTRVVELRCDAEAARHTSRTAVARCLVEVAQWLKPLDAGGGAQAPAAMAMHMAARPSALRERVEAALESARPSAMRGIARGGLCVVSLAAMTVAAPGVGVSAAEQRGEAPALARETGSWRARLLPFVEQLNREYDATVQLAQRLRAQLLGARTDDSTTARLAELDRRLQSLSRLKQRLKALLGRI